MSRKRKVQSTTAEAAATLSSAAATVSSSSSAAVAGTSASTSILSSCYFSALVNSTIDRKVGCRCPLKRGLNIGVS